MLRPLIVFALLLPVSCADKEPPVAQVAQPAFDEEAGPRQTASVKGVTNRRAAAKANATAQSSDLVVLRRPE